MAEPTVRTVLLAREGDARDRLVEALVEAGADVQAVDPLQVEPAAVDALAPAVIVVALEPAIEDALDAFDAVTADPARTVLFEEVALVLKRSGWDAARWVRHLAAKLHPQRSVLPPGAEPPDDESAPPREPAAASTPDASEASPLRDRFDPVAAEFDDGGDGEAAPDVVIEPIRFERDELTFAPAGTATGYAFDPVAAEFDEDTDAAPAAPVIEFDFDPASIDDEDSYTAPVPDTDAPAGLDLRLVDETPEQAAPVDGPGRSDRTGAGERADPTHVDVGTVQEAHDVDDGTLRLLDVDAATPLAHSTPSQARAPLDLDELESRISGLSLDDTDSYGQGPRRGVVLVEGGLGGPDAVRQLLAAIPEGFPRPILIRLQLDGGRYDRLVRQMERVTPLTVQLAEAGMSVAAGEVYFLPPGLLPALSGGALRFADGGDLAALPDAVPADDSAVLFLSGADADLVDIAMGPAWQGALVGGQSDEGCYDAAAAHAVAARGGPSGLPRDIADWLLARWMPAARPSEPGPGGLSL